MYHLAGLPAHPLPGRLLAWCALLPLLVPTIQRPAPGTAYVYLNYGLYWLLNVVTEPVGIGGAVLIRAVAPVEGLAFMQACRPAMRRPRDLTNGPGKLTQAFDIDGPRHHRRLLTRPPLYFEAGTLADGERLATSARIGLNRGIALPWRFYLADDPYVSPGKPSDQARRRPR